MDTQFVNCRCEDKSQNGAGAGKFICFLEGRLFVYTVLEWSSLVVNESFVRSTLATMHSSAAFGKLVCYQLRTHRGGYMGKSDQPQLVRFYMHYNEQGMLVLDEDVAVPWQSQASLSQEIEKWLHSYDLIKVVSQIFKQKAVA